LKQGERRLVDGSYPNVHLQMARIHRQENDIPRTIVELHRTLELDPANAQAKRLLEQVSHATP
jgi:hypothetical protein